MATYFIDGRLTRDAEMKSNSDGRCYYSFAIAWNRGKNKPAHFYNCTMDEKRGTKIAPYLKKGKYVIVVGEPDWYEYDGKTYETIRVDKLTLAGSSSDERPIDSPNPEGKPYEMDGKYFDTREELDAYKEQVFGAKSPDGMKGPETFDDFDIPF